MFLKYIFYKIYNNTVGTIVGTIVEATPYFSRGRIFNTMIRVIEQVMLPAFCKRPYIPTLVYFIGLILLIPFIIAIMLYTFSSDIFERIIEDYYKFKLEHKEKK